MRDFVKRYGIVGIGTHTVLGAMWFGGIYTGITFGVDLQELFASAGFDIDMSDTSNLIATWLAYKAIQPPRMAFILLVTPFVAHQIFL